MTPRTNNPLVDQVQKLPDVIRETTWKLEEQARTLLTTEEHHGLRSATFTGCGDSRIAAHAASFAWQSLTGVKAGHENALDLSRFSGRTAALGRPKEHLILAVSSSGRVARVVEAAQQNRRSDTIVCAVSADPASDLATKSDRVLGSSFSAEVEGPGLCSYVVSLLSLYHLAIRCGEVRGRYTMDKAGELRQALEATAGAVEQTLELSSEAAEIAAEQWNGHEVIEYLGAGPDRAAAAFGAAKLLEAAGMRAYDQDVEEFMHLQYFEGKPGSTPTVVVAPSKSPARSRIEEVLGFITNLGRPLLTVGDITSSSRSLRYETPDPLFAPIAQAVPLALLAGHLMDMRNEKPGRGGIGPWSDSRDGAAVQRSRIETEPERGA